MSVCRRLSNRKNFSGVPTRVGTFALVALLGVCASGAALAGTPAAFFNDASVIGLNKVISATQVPVQTSTGAIIYKDVTIEINVDAAGNLSYATAAPLAVLSPPLSSDNIRAGIYAVETNTSLGMQVTGPAPIGSGGEAQWSIDTATGYSCWPPISAQFFTGPPANNPLAARAKKAGITATQYNFGTIGDSACPGDNGFFWGTNTLIGVTSVGPKLIVASFTYRGTDQSTPTEQITYTFVK